MARQWSVVSSASPLAARSSASGYLHPRMRPSSCRPCRMLSVSADEVASCAFSDGAFCSVPSGVRSLRHCLSYSPGVIDQTVELPLGMCIHARRTTAWGNRTGLDSLDCRVSETATGIIGFFPDRSHDLFRSIWLSANAVIVTSLYSSFLPSLESEIDGSRPKGQMMERERIDSARAQCPNRSEER
jgi:hypothetical protein